MRKFNALMATIAAALALLLGVGPAFAALTVTGNQPVSGNKHVRIMQVAFDSSYAAGGEALDYTALGFSAGVDQVRIQPQKGYAFDYDYTNKKIRVYAVVPAMVIEETHTITQSGSTYLVTLDYPAAFIVNVSNSTDSILPVHGSGTAAQSAHYAFDFAEGVRTPLYFNVGNNNTSVKVTYATQAWKDVWENVVEGEAVTVSGNGAALAFNASAVMAVKADNATSGKQVNATKFLDKDDSAATGEVCWNWTPTTGNTNATFSGADAIQAATVTYLKKPASGFLLDNWVEEETATLRADGNQTMDNPVLLWGYANQVPINAQTTQTLVSQGGTNGTNQGYFHWYSRGFYDDAFRFPTTQQTAATTCTYIKGDQGQVQTQMMEVANGTDLSDLTGIRIEIIGR
jgi:hypothetical protein